MFRPVTVLWALETLPVFCQQLVLNKIYCVVVVPVTQRT